MLDDLLDDEDIDANHVHHFSLLKIVEERAFASEKNNKLIW